MAVMREILAMASRRVLCLPLFASVLGLTLLGQTYAQSLDLGHYVALTSSEPITGVTTTNSGRVFVLFPHLDGSDGVRVAEAMADGSFRIFPSSSWNEWHVGDDPKVHLIGPNSVRMGEDGLLWIVDTGTRGFGSRVVAGGAKLVGFDPLTGATKHLYSLSNAIKPRSYVDDVRFAGRTAVFTDAGSPGLILLNMKTGAVRRVLEHIPAVTAARPMRASGRVLKAGGQPVYIHADQLELSPD